MVLLSEDPAYLISSAYNAYSIGTDTEQLNTIQTNLARIEKLRQQKLAESEKVIRDLQFALKHVKEEADTNVHLHQRKDHGNKMYALDKEKFALAKAINERESTTHELENEKARLEERLAELEEEDRRGDVYGNPDDTILKLKLYRGMGIEIKEDETGQYSTAMIQNKGQNDIHIVNIEKKYSSHFYSEYFWNAL